MKTKLIVILLLTFTTNVVFGQSKKELRSTVLRLQSDSTSLDNKLKENTIIISSLKTEISESKILNSQLNKRIEALVLEQQANLILADSIKKLNASLISKNAKLDSLNSYYKIIDFVETFYNSLELSDEENLRQYEYGDVKFDLENFNSLISKDARYSKGRVKNLTDEKSHDKYFIMLQNIDEIKFGLNTILVKTKVMYSGDNMGLFYNDEQLTIRDNKGLLKLTDWVDLDLYKIAPTIEWNDVTFTRNDFYKWIDGRPK